jgi:TatD DNase family protein
VTLTDTHCHLYFNKFDDDRDEVITRAVETGVTKILVPGITRETSLAAVQLADAHPEVYAAIGIHPTDALTWTDDTPTYLRDLAKNPRIKALGEIGLDYYWDAAPHNLQQDILKAQLALAEELSLPVVLHLREKADALYGNCAEDLLSLLGEWVIGLRSRAHPLTSRPGVLHSFSGNAETAQRAIDLGFMLGVTGPVTFKKADQRREVIASIPLTHLLLETDAPFLAPEPKRGRRNEPAYVAYVAEKVAEIHAKTPAEIAEITSANAARLFSW